MIDLHYWPTPNGKKVTILLEECGLPYKIVPVNIGRSLPVPVGTVSALTAAKFTQALSENLILYAGKINTVDNLQQPFMPGRGLDAGFMNGAFVFNPVLGRTIPYSTFGAGGCHPGGRSAGGHADCVRYARCLHHERLRQALPQRGDHLSHA